jgi:hypothetical protein
MMKLKGFGRKMSWPSFKVRSQNLPGGTDEEHEKLQTGQPVFVAQFEPETSRIRSRSVDHSTTGFGTKCC